MEKYRARKEGSPGDSISRVVSGVYAQDEESGAAIDAHEAMIAGLWIPGGRIQAGAGTDRVVTLLNCYVDRTIDDSMSGIADALKDAMLTMQQGGGIGMDFSTLRPRGAYLTRTDAVASGPLPFMTMWDSMCGTIMSAGSRRGAMMGVMHCEHPDLLEFIEAKHTAGTLTNFNVSVLITDAFMDAVVNDAEWYLGFGVPRADGIHLGTMEREDGVGRWYIYSGHKARDLWDMIIQSTYEYSEPGVIFIDRINDTNNLGYREVLNCTNPCGEQPLPPNGACNLGAVNLARLVNKPFTPEAHFNFDMLSDVVAVGVRFLDNVIDVTGYPLASQRKEMEQVRRIGLGITGLANAMAELGIIYGSEAALSFTDTVMAHVKNATYESSALLAAERGPFPAYDEKLWGVHSPVVHSLNPHIKALIAKHGIRNGVLLTIAPTGTTSLYCGNISSGLEPVFDLTMKRKVRQPDGSFKEFLTYDYGALLYKSVTGLEPDSSGVLTTVRSLDVRDHVRIQAVCQKHVDASISKTINCPEDISFKDFKLVYWDAYNMGCKGCTTYRPSPVRGSILESGGVPSVTNSNSNSNSNSGSSSSSNSPTIIGSTVAIDLIKRPEELSGRTYKIKWPSAASAYYVTINDYEGAPFEIFIASTAATHQDWATALSLMISAVFRKGGNIAFVGEELQRVVSATDGAWLQGKYWGSLVAMVGFVIQKHIDRHKVHETTTTVSAEVHVAVTDEGGGEVEVGVISSKGSVCPQCSAPALIHKEGCKTCNNCGYSTCS